MRLFTLGSTFVTFGAAFGAAGCRTATQITVEATTDMHCVDHGGTTVTIGSLDTIASRSAAAAAFTCDDTTHRIGSVVVVPSGANDAEVLIKVVSGVGVDPESCDAPDNAKRCIVAKRLLRFLPHESLTVDVSMRLDCRGVPCGDTETCVHGACVPARIPDSNACIGSVGCDDGVLGGADGGTDASSDATIDATLSDAAIDSAPDSAIDAGVDAHVDAGPNDVLTMSLGSTYSCALMGDHTVKCWGANNLGQVGQSDTTHDYLTPVTVPNLKDVQQIAGKSSGHTCVLFSDKTVSCWGENSSGQLGRGTNVYSDPVPGKVVGIPSVRQIATGERHSCVLRDDGNAVWCWGQYGASGTESNPGVLISGLPTLADIAAGSEWSAGRTASGAVWTWGVNYYAQLGIGNDDAGIENLTAQSIAIAPVTQIALGDNHGCGLFTNGTASCWGDNRIQQLGRDTSGADIPTPSIVPNLSNAKRLEMGSLHSCAILNDATVACWGSNDVGQNGSPIIHDAKTDPTVVTSLGTGVTEIWAGFEHNCARTGDGTIKCWGQNDHGELGDGTTSAGPTPRAIVW